MKTTNKITALFLSFILIVSAFTFSVSAESENKDPNFDFHMMISTHIDELRDIRDAKIQPLQKQIDEYQCQAKSLVETKDQYTSALQEKYDIVVANITENESAIDKAKREYFDNINNYLSEMGFSNPEEINNGGQLEKVFIPQELMQEKCKPPAL